MTEFISNIGEESLGYITMVIRFILPVLAVLIVLHCGRLLLKKDEAEPESVYYLTLPNGTRIPLARRENVVGRAKASDVYLEYPTLSRTHAAIIRTKDDEWRIYDIRPFTKLGKGGWFFRKTYEPHSSIMVNNTSISGKEGTPVNFGDIINIGGVELCLLPPDNGTPPPRPYESKRRKSKQKTALVLLTNFQALLGIQLSISQGQELSVYVPLAILLLIGIMWAAYAVSRSFGRIEFELETLAFLLCTIGLSVAISVNPGGIFRHIIFLLAGIISFFALSFILKNLERAKKLRLPAAIAGILLLGANILFAEEQYGARRWLTVGDFSFQPSEFVKVAFIFLGAATLDRLFAKRNLLVFIGFAGICVLSMAIINDFGSALVFFVTYLIIAFLRSGDFATIFLSVGGAGFAGFLAMNFRPHLIRRFETWGNVWEHIDAAGFQQTRAMSAAASGGLFGVGAGEGWFKNIFAADNDLVFALVAEELGLIVALCAVGALILPLVYAFRSVERADSSFYAIGACAAASVLAFQMSLNVLGSLDVLPFTGITFPFVSRGGTSLIACWGLLAFIKGRARQ